MACGCLSEVATFAGGIAQLPGTAYLKVTYLGPLEIILSELDLVREVTKGI